MTELKPIPLPGSSDPIVHAVPESGIRFSNGGCFIRRNGRGIDVYDEDGEQFLFHLNGSATEFDVRHRVQIWEAAFDHGMKHGRKKVQTQIKNALGLK